MAAITLTTVNFNNSSDANFRAWVSFVIAAIVAGGWVQTSDTGQINTATVLAPLVVSTSQGYAVFRSNDATASLHEIYIKVEFGSGATSATRPAMWLTAGWATDGAGNIVTTTFAGLPRGAFPVGATPAGASISVNMAAGAGYFIFASTSSLAAEHLILSLERDRNSDLTFKDEFIVFGSATGLFGPTGGYSQVVNRDNAFPFVQPLSNCFVMPANANSPIAAKAGLGLVFGFAPGNTSPSMNIYGVETSAIGVYQDTVAVPILSVNHNYKIQRTLLFADQGSTVLLTRFE